MVVAGLVSNLQHIVLKNYTVPKIAASHPHIIPHTFKRPEGCLAKTLRQKCHAAPGCAARQAGTGNGIRCQACHYFCLPHPSVRRRVSTVRAKSRHHIVAKANRIIDPAVNGGFPPTRTVNADLHLRRESSLGDLAIHGGAGQASSGENGFQTDYSFEVRHGTCFHSLTVTDTPSDPRVGHVVDRYKNICGTWCLRVQAANIGKEKLWADIGRHGTAVDGYFRRFISGGNVQAKPSALCMDGAGHRHRRKIAPPATVFCSRIARASRPSSVLETEADLPHSFLSQLPTNPKMDLSTTSLNAVRQMFTPSN